MNDKYYDSLKTFFCESKFALRLYYLPKNTTFGKHFPSRTRMVDLRWDQNHIADYVIHHYGESERTRRKNWQKRAWKFIEDHYRFLV